MSKLITYEDLKKCTNNPSLMLTKFVKKNGPMMLVQWGKNPNELYWVKYPDELVKVRGNTYRSKEGGVTLLRFWNTTWPNAMRQRFGYYLVKGKTKQLDRFKDITEKFLDEYLQMGMCSYTDRRHDFIQYSKRRRNCKYCGKRQGLYTVIEKSLEWRDL